MTPGTRRLLTACLFAFVIAAPIAALTPSGQAPTWNTQPTRNHQEGDAITILFRASNHVDGVTTYSASNLPPGLSINATTGLVSGTLTSSATDQLDGSAGTRTVTLTATNGAGSAQTSFTWHVSRFRKGDVFAGIGLGRYQVFSEDGIYKYTLQSETQAEWEASGSGGSGTTTGCGYNWVTRKLYFTSFDDDNDPHVIEINPVPVSSTPANAFPRNRLSTFRDGGLERGLAANGLAVDGAPESVVFDGQGNMYVGHAGGYYNAAGINADNQDRPIIDSTDGFTTSFYIDAAGNPVRSGGTPIPYTQGFSKTGVIEKWPGEPWPIDAGSGQPLIRWGRDIQKFTRNATTNELSRTGSFDAHSGWQGSDWLDLSSDQRTVYYTSEWGVVYRYDVGSGVADADRQLSDFVVLPPVNNATQVLYALRLLPPGDGTAGLLVATATELLRLNQNGDVITKYDAGVDGWFALNIAPDGRSLWSASTVTGRIYKWEISSGRILPLGASSTTAGIQTNAEVLQLDPGGNPARYSLDGLCVMGEYTAAQEICGNNTDDDGDGEIDEICQPIEACSNSSPGDDDGDGLVDSNDPDCGAENICSSSGYTDASIAGYCARFNYEGDSVTLLPAPGPSDPDLREDYTITGREYASGDPSGTPSGPAGLPPGISFDANAIATGVPAYTTILNTAATPKRRQWRITVNVERKNIKTNSVIATYQHAFDWTIENRNRPPVATDHTRTIRPGTTAAIDVIAADGAVAADSDPDTEDVITITSNTNPANGTLSRSGNTFTYTPNTGFVGTDSYTYTISDGYGGTDSATVTITVANTRPEPRADHAVTRPGRPVLIDVLANDLDADGDTLTIIDNTSPGNGTLTRSGGVFTYTPSLTFTGDVAFLYTVTDPYGSTAQARVTVDVINTPPVARNDAATTRPGQAVAIAVLANDTDADAPPTPAAPDTLTITSNTNPLNGTAACTAASCTYTPNTGYVGPDNFAYFISDGFGGTALARVDITSVNSPPVAVDDSATTRPGQAVTISVLTNDSDADGDTLTITAKTNPSNGTVTCSTTSCTYTPNAGYAGADSFTYTISDGFGGTATATVRITSVNSPPVAVDDSATMVAGGPPLVINVRANDPADPDGDPVTITGFTQPANGTVVLNGDGTFTFTPAAGFSGVTTFTYTISDGFGGVDTATVTVNVTNRPPIAVNDSATARGTVPVTISVLSNDGDPDLHVISISGATNPSNGTITINPNGTITYQANAGFEGTDTFTYTIRDGYGGEATAIVTITVGPPNRFDPCTCSQAKASPGEIWPPNHKQTQVVNVTNLVDPVSGQPLAIRILGIYQDEPTNYLGDGETTIDAGGVGTSTAWVRAERTGNPNIPGNGRVYEIVFEATAPDGSSCQGSIFTGVPHDQGQGRYIIDDGIRYDSTVAGGPIVRNALRVERNLTDQQIADAGFVAKYAAQARIGGSGSSQTEVQVGPSIAAPADQDHFTWTNGQEVVFMLLRRRDGVELRLVTGGDDDDEEAEAEFDITCANGECNDLYLRAQAGGTGKITLSSLNFNGVPLAETLTIDVGGAPRAIRLSGLALTTGATLTGIAKIEWTGTRPADSAVNFQILVGKACPSDAGTGGGGGIGTPPLARADTYETDEDTPLTVSAGGILGNDLTFAGPLSASLVTPPSYGTLTLNANGSFVYTPNANFNGVDTFRYKVSDGVLESQPATVTITVRPVADPPLAVNDSAATDENVPVTIPVTSNDSDPAGGTLSVVSATQGSNGKTAISGTSILYTPATGFVGTDTFSYTVSGAEGTATATVTVVVRNVNEAPVAANDSYSTAEDTPLTVAAPGVKNNDSDPDAGDQIAAAIVSQPSNGTVTLNANGSFTYTPNANYNGQDTFTYRVTDGGGLASDAATVTITITPVNDPPVAVNDSYAVQEDSALQMTVPGVKQNDSDPDTAAGDLTVTLVSGVQRGTLTLNPDGSFLYTPLPNVSGADSFTYRLSDGSSTSNVATVTIAITDTPDPPQAADDSATTPEETAVSIPVLANDSDPDTATLTIQGVSQPANGTAAVVGGQIRYTPNANFNGQDTFTYTVTDGTNVATAKVVVTVTAVNDPPVADNDSYSTSRNTVLNVQTPGVLGNDSDPDQSAQLSAVIVTQPSNGTVVLQTHGAFAYTPRDGFTGTDTFTYKVSDGSAESAPATVTITVTANNRPPVAANDSYSASRNTPLTIAAPGVLANDSDPDNGDTITAFLISSVAANTGTLTLNPNGSFTYTPANDFTGSATFRYRARDEANAESNEAIVTITVSASNRPPVASNDSYTTDRNEALTIAAPGVLSNDSDPDDDDDLTATLVSGPASNTGTLTLNPNGSFTFTPANDYTGTATFRYRARDEAGADSNEATVTITIEDTPSSGQVCYDGGPANPAARAILTWNTAANGDVTVRASVSRNYSDNTYGVNRIGWRRHTFADIYRSDMAQIALFDGDNTRRLEFAIDYLSPRAGTPSGYGTAGVAGGRNADGGMIVGNASDIASISTSMDLNMNAFGYVSASANHPLKEYSPPTNASYVTNATYPLWIWDVWYEATVRGGAFGSAGFGSARLVNIHASPAKIEVNSWRQVSCQ